MNKNYKYGWIALGLVAIAYWKYKMKPEQKARLKNKLFKVDKKLFEQISDYKDVVRLPKDQYLA